MTAVEFAQLVQGARQRADGVWWDARCPGHQDHRASLSFTDGERALVVECHAGCSRERIAGGVGRTVADFTHQVNEGNGGSRTRGRIIATYDYRDERGTLLYQEVRFEPKDFRLRRPDGQGGFTWNLAGVRRVVYRLDELPEHRRVWLVEGPKDVDRLRSIGLPATTTAGGAAGWRDEYAQQVRDAGVEEVVACRDNDDAGARYMQRAAGALTRRGVTVRMLDLPGLEPHGDVSAWLDAGGLPDALDDLAALAPVFRAADGAGADAQPADPPRGPAADGTSPRPRLGFRRALEVLHESPPVAIVDGVAWPHSVTVLVSESGTGKTFVLIDLSAAVSGGRAWHGRAVRPGTVAYVSFEGDALGLRLRAVHEAGGELQHVYIVQASEPLSPRVERDGRELPAPGEAELADAVARVAAAAADSGGPPLRLLIIDTVRTSLAGSEDRSEDVSGYLRAVRRLLAPYPDAGAILAHHAGWQDGDTRRRRERGSSALRGNVEATLYLEVAADTPATGVAELRLTALKVRDDAKPPPSGSAGSA